MIRKLIRWLARHEIAETYEAARAIERAMWEQETKLRLDLAYARGEVAGQERAFQAVEDEVRGQRIEEEDIARARKGIRH